MSVIINMGEAFRGGKPVLLQRRDLMDVAYAELVRGVSEVTGCGASARRICEAFFSGLRDGDDPGIDYYYEEGALNALAQYLTHEVACFYVAFHALQEAERAEMEARVA